MIDKNNDVLKQSPSALTQGGKLGRRQESANVTKRFKGAQSTMLARAASTNYISRRPNTKNQRDHYGGNSLIADEQQN